MRAATTATAVLWGALLLAPGPGARAGEDAADRPSVPVANASYVFDAERLVTEALAAAEAAASDPSAWERAVRALQDVVEAPAAEGQGTVPPAVVAVRGAEVYEGAARAAHHRVLGGGAVALGAYRATYGKVAAALLERGVEERDRARLAECVRRFLPLAEGRRAALLLADLALARGDADEALGWLGRLEEAEQVTAEPPEAVAPWREARLAREAAALAPTPADLAATRETLAAAAREGLASAVRAGERLRARRPAAAPASWTTTGGGPGRAVPAAALGAAPTLAWWEAASGAFDEGGPEVRRDRPSPAVLSEALVLDGTLVVSDGRRLRAWAFPAGVGGTVRRSLAPLTEEPGAPSGGEFEEEEPGWRDPRETYGLVEGHALTATRHRSGVWIVYAAVKEPRTTSDAGALGDDCLRAFSFDGRRFAPLWRAGGRRPSRGNEPSIRLYGAPLLYRGRLWVGGLRPTESSDRFEAWLLALDPLTGRTLGRTLLGLSNPVRTGRADEAVPSSPAGAEGLVFVVTGLGIAAAVDAEDGRPAWVLRYDRDIVAPGRAGRLRHPSGESPRESTFQNGPPLAAFGRVWIAPTDSSKVMSLLQRPRGATRELLAWRRWRLGEQFGGMAAEQLVGLATAPDGDATLVVAGRPAATEADPPGPVVVGVEAFGQGTLRWQGSSPTGAEAPYGRALLTSREVLVPTTAGIAMFGTGGGATPGAFLGLAASEALPEETRELLPEGIVPYGSLVPWPGRGLLAVNEAWIALWKR